MAAAFTSDKLIRSVKRRAMIPENQSTFLDADFLEFANEEISLGLLPSILRLHEDYLLFTDFLTVDQDSINIFIYNFSGKGAAHRNSSLFWLTPSNMFKLDRQYFSNHYG